MLRRLNCIIKRQWKKGMIVLARTSEGAFIAGRGLAKRVHKYRFRDCGENVSFSSDDSFTYENITVGSNVLIGQGAIVWSTNANITIGSNVIIGPQLIVMTGNHNIDEVGKYMCDVREKRSSDDEDVVIDGDVWIGARVTILKGVTVGRGAVIGAGSVVTKPVAPYMIVAGNPAKNIRSRWPLAVILQHETVLYEESMRLAEAELRLAGHR